MTVVVGLRIELNGPDRLFVVFVVVRKDFGRVVQQLIGPLQDERFGRLGCLLPVLEHQIDLGQQVHGRALRDPAGLVVVRPCQIVDGKPEVVDNDPVDVCRIGGLFFLADGLRRLGHQRDIAVALVEIEQDVGSEETGLRDNPVAPGLVAVEVHVRSRGDNGIGAVEGLVRLVPVFPRSTVLRVEIGVVKGRPPIFVERSDSGHVGARDEPVAVARAVVHPGREVVKGHHGAFQALGRVQHGLGADERARLLFQKALTAPGQSDQQQELRSQRVGIDRYVFMAIPLFSVSERSQSGGSEGQIHAKGQRPGYRVALDVALLGVVGLEVRPVVEVIPREIEPHAIDADAGRQRGR